MNTEDSRTSNSMCKHLEPLPVGSHNLTLQAGPYACPWCEIERLEAELEQANGIRSDREILIELMRGALGVSIEPHQTLSERLVEAAGKSNVDWCCPHYKPRGEGCTECRTPEPEPDETDAETCRLTFQAWANDLGLCLDEIFMSSDGVPEHPYEDNDTNQFWRAWLASWKAKRAAQPTAAGCAQCSNVAPIAKLTVRDGLAVRAGLYAPGLPDGDHDVYPAASSQPPQPDAVEALRPFVELYEKVDERYRKRGGTPDQFTDTHPFADIPAGDLPMGVWRRAQTAFRASQPPYALQAKVELHRGWAFIGDHIYVKADIAGWLERGSGKFLDIQTKPTMQGDWIPLYMGATSTKEGGQ